MHDELLVDTRHLLRFLARRKAMGIGEVLCALPVAWCRQQQLLNESRCIRMGIEVSILHLAIRGFRVQRQYGARSMRKGRPDRSLLRFYRQPAGSRRVLRRISPGSTRTSRNVTQGEA